MPKFIPFTAHVRVVPDRGNGKRFEYVRDLQKIATLVYSELDDDSDINIASPGGGQHRSFNGGGDAWGGLANGTAIKPQIGEFPAQLMITGFLSSTDKNNPAHPDKSIIHTNSHQTGVGGNHGWLANPTTAIDSYATIVKNKLDAALTTVLSSADWNVFKIDIAGVLYGAGGYHFPR